MPEIEVELNALGGGTIEVYVRDEITVRELIDAVVDGYGDYVEEYEEDFDAAVQEAIREELQEFFDDMHYLDKDDKLYSEEGAEQAYKNSVLTRFYPECASLIECLSKPTVDKITEELWEDERINAESIEFGGVTWYFDIV